MEENEINKICLYYNLGGEGTKERPSYPHEYGARCELYDEFFSTDKDGNLSPNCYKCCKNIEKLLRLIC